MPNNVTDADLWTTTVQSIADGEPANAANFELGIKDLADRTTNLRKGIPGIAASFTTRISIAAEQYNASSRFTGPALNLLWVQSDVTDAGNLRFHVPTQLVGKLDRVAVRVTGGTGAQHSALPATMPKVEVHKATGLTGSGSIIGSPVTDSSGDVPTYEALHYIEVTGLAETIVSTAEYYVEIRGETGANSVASAFRVLGIEATFIP